MECDLEISNECTIEKKINGGEWMMFLSLSNKLNYNCERDWNGLLITRLYYQNYAAD